MKVLLDTHTFLWYVEDAPQISASALEIINDGDNEVFFSMASAWEIAIKFGLGKLQLPAPFEEFIARQTKLNDFEWLEISLHHISILPTLPQHHRDPFDRLLVAQAQSENLIILSADVALNAYDIARRW